MITKLLATSAALISLAAAGKAEAQYYYPTTPVYAAPAAPVVNAYPGPVYYGQPVYAQPTYVQPVYATPVYAAPAYAPYYAGYYSPLSIGLNFGFGGRHWR